MLAGFNSVHSLARNAKLYREFSLAPPTFGPQDAQTVIHMPSPAERSSFRLERRIDCLAQDGHGNDDCIKEDTPEQSVEVFVSGGDLNGFLRVHRSMSDPKKSPDQFRPPVPDATEVAKTTALLSATHKQETSLLQHALDRLTAIVGWPGFVVLLSLTVLIWISFNTFAQRLGIGVFDPPPFNILQNITSTGALLISALIVTTQRREDALADHRAHLTLELSIANDRKIAKIIGLLEESRRDNPAIADRIDAQAASMSVPSNAEVVLGAIKDIRDSVE